MMYQTLAQLRNQTPLTLDKPAGSVALKYRDVTIKPRKDIVR